MVVSTFLVAVLAALLVVGRAAAVTIAEFAADPDSKLSFPVNITSGPEGNLWWTDIGAHPGIARMTPDGEYLPRLADPNKPVDVVVSASGWASWVSQNGTGERAPGGTVSIHPSKFVGSSIILTPDEGLRWGGHGPNVTSVCRPLQDSDHFGGLELCLSKEWIGRVSGMAASGDGVIWASVEDRDLVLQMNLGLSDEKLIELPVGSRPTGIAVGPEGNAWVAMWGAGAIDRLTPAGARTRFPLPAGSRPNDIVLGPDGAFWITESGTGKIGRIDTAGTLTDEYPVPSGEIGQVGITVGPDAAIWYADPEAGLVGRLVPDPPGNPLAPVGPSGPGVAPGSDDGVAPRFLSPPSFKPARFRVAGRSGARPAGRRPAAPTGAKLTFALSEPATVTATVVLKAAGRRAGRKCVAPRKAKPGAARCIRRLAKGSLRLDGKAGVNRTPFSGKLNGKALVPGRYLAKFVARDAAGNASASVSASFTVVR
ncbi:MAG: hypothetical protein BGO11_07550 [Solirubrobacterales bacterium 70-9]|nr:MAG: hypothetical protein BGO11_07550 [Solirubrobacterales bacterium 70-9]